MTTTLAFRFPWGRYHATPWGRHVNEGAVELPPSPWRLLRSLYAVWCTRVPDLDQHTVHSLFDNLSRRPPTVFVPPHRLAHTRHYYPGTKHTRASASVNRTLDAFAVFDHEAELAVRWRDLELDGAQRDALAKLAASLPYLGRADSICEAWLADRWERGDHEAWEPVDVVEFIPDHAEVTTVLAPEWPLDLDALVARPVDVRKGGLLFPAGTRFVGYQKLETAPTSRLPQSHIQVTAVRFAVAQRVCPPQTDALVYTDLLRMAALRKLGKHRAQRADTMLGGKTADGLKARDDHQHAHYLPLIENKRITGLLVWVPGRLGGDELAALTEVRCLSTGMNDKWRLTLRATDTGDVADIAPELSQPSQYWHSLTPFTPSRYRKNRGWEEFLRSEIERELGYRPLGDVRVTDLTIRDERTSFRRSRLSSPDRPRPSVFMSVRLDGAIPGPLTLGHLSHFGLGLFAPA